MHHVQEVKDSGKLKKKKVEAEEAEATKKGRLKI
jgi:hypothetical protein